MTTPPPAVLQVCTSDRGGGAEAAAFALHHELRARGVEATLAVGFARSGEGGVVELGGGALHGAARRRGLPRVARLARALRDPGVAADLARGREDVRFPGSRAVLGLARSVDLVHLHNLHGGYFDLRLVPELTALRPTVLTLHDEWAYTGHCALTLGCERWRDACGSCPHLDVYPRLRVDGTAGNLRRKRELWSRSHLHIVAPSRWLLERAQESVLAGAATSWEVVSNGVDLDTFRPGDRRAARAELGLPEGAGVVVVTATGGAQNPFKDAETLERALRRLGEEDGPPVVAVTLGAAGTPLRHGRVEVRRPGFVDRAAVARHLRAADAYAHPARAEVQGIGLIEALACGVPVVSSSVGGIPEVVRDGETGMLVPPGHPAALAGALDALLGDPARAAAMGAAGAREAAVRFGIDAHVEAMLGVYDRALRTLPAC